MARSQVATDDFNRATLDANWAQIVAGSASVVIDGSIRIHSGTSFYPGAVARWVGAGTFNADQYSKIAMVSEDTNINDPTYTLIGAVVRCSADTDAGRDFYYYRIMESSGQYGNAIRLTQLGKFVNGASSVLDSGDLQWNEGDTIELEVVGNVLTGYRNGTATGHTATDSDIATGQPGVIVGGICYGDNWEAGNVTAGTTPITVNNLPTDSLAGGEIV